MERERYPGERVGLRLFALDLLPVVERELGQEALVLHAIRRALRIGSLSEYRRVRRMFNLLPAATKQRLSIGIVARQAERHGAEPTIATPVQAALVPRLTAERRPERLPES
jgi:hypothetical protein